MRFEAKHRISKISARSSFNRRNICLTLAIKRQLQLNKIFNLGKLCSMVNIGPSKFVIPSKLKQIQDELNLSTEKQLICVSWAEVKGTRYKINSILTKDLDDRIPHFVMVKTIFINGSHKIIFECCLLTTVDFDEHTYAYEVNIHESNRDFIFQDTLISPIPNTLNIVSNGNHYVTCRDPL